jgi:hypothetical protein
MSLEPGPYDDHPLQDRLQAFRLIRIERLADEVISCTFSVHQILGSPPFIALSYTWGPPSPTKYISVDGYRLQIRKNLYLALNSLLDHEDKYHAKTPADQSPSSYESTSGNVFRYFSSFTKSHMGPYFWIDQICINQTDLLERNDQVQEMGAIFSRASLVLAWLGPEDATSDAAISILQNPSVKVTPTAQKHIKVLCDREYWTRLWIIQETVLAPRILCLCGGRTFRFDVLQRLVNDTSLMMYAATEPDVVDFANMLSHSKAASLMQIKTLAERHLHWDSAERMTLGQGIMLCMNQECSDVRDKIYGILSIVNTSTSLRPDYRRSARELYWDCAVDAAINHNFEVQPVQSICRTFSYALGLNLDDLSLAVNFAWLEMLRNVHQQIVSSPQGFAPRALDPEIELDIDLSMLKQLDVQPCDIITSVMEPFLPPTNLSLQRFACYLQESQSQLEPITNRPLSVEGDKYFPQGLSGFVWLVVRARVFYGLDASGRHKAIISSSLESRIRHGSFPAFAYNDIMQALEPFTGFLDSAGKIAQDMNLSEFYDAVRLIMVQLDPISEILEDPKWSTLANTIDQLPSRVAPYHKVRRPSLRQILKIAEQFYNDQKSPWDPKHLEKERACQAFLGISIQNDKAQQAKEESPLEEDNFDRLQIGLWFFSSAVLN